MTPAPAEQTPNGWFKQKFSKVAQEFGDAVLEKEDRKVCIPTDISDDFLAAAFGSSGQPESPIVFLPGENKFYVYDLTSGIYSHLSAAAFEFKVSNLLKECANAFHSVAGCNPENLKFKLSNSGRLKGVISRAKAVLAVADDFFETGELEFVPCKNGILRLADKMLLPFSPAFHL